MQATPQLSTTPPLPGVVAVPALNAALQTIATDFSGDTDPAALAWPLSKWADTANNLVKRRNAANTEWVIEAALLRSHIPTIPLSEIPPLDIGTIYVPGVGNMTWSGGSYKSDQETGVIKSGGFKNVLINSNFTVNQRGVGGTVTLGAGAYGHDRWKAGSGGCTYTHSTSAGITTVSIIAGSLVQVVEGSALRAGTYSLSWGGNAQGRIGSGSYSATGVSGAVSGGTNVSVEFGVGTVSTPQFELGLRASMYEFRPVGMELLLCQRYYETSGGQFGFTNPGSNATTVQYLSHKFAVQKRAVPTVTRAVANGTIVVQAASIDFVTWNFQNGGMVNNVWSWIADAEL